MQSPVPITEAPSPHPLAATLRLCCFDVDGTIMNSAHQISQQTRAVFDYLTSREIKIGLATGRPLFGIQTLLKSLPITAPCSLFGGALLYDPIRQQSIHQAFLSSNTIAALIAICREQQLYLELYTTDSFATESAGSPFSVIHAEYLGRQPDPISDFYSLVGQNIFKAVVMVAVTGQKAAVSLLESSVPDCVAACSPGAAHPEVMFINITTAQNSRTDTFAALLTHQGITADAVLSFGDGETDREFLSAAGIGIAMQGGSKLALAAADYVTPGVDNEGVHRAISQLFAVHI